MATPDIRPFSPITPTLYCYTTPGVEYHDGWCKIGYTEKQTVEERVAQQTHTAGIQANIEWQEDARYRDGSGDWFRDSDFHGYLTGKRDVEREPRTEWFHLDPEPAMDFLSEFVRREVPTGELEHTEYVLRDEQADAVHMTREYFEHGGTEFLWNAKPRFGKTLATYDLIRSMGLRRVLIVTNRPSIANSWYDDFVKFFAWREEAQFVSDNQALENALYSMRYQDFFKRWYASDGETPAMVAFESLQGLKGSVYFGGDYKKLRWASKLEFDLLVVDESHEGVDTIKTERAFDNIKRKHTLYLSGTPFKALATGQFATDQIYNWSYADEQERKETWEGDGFNPYAELPRLEMYTYQLSAIAEGTLEKGAAIGDGESTMDYAFDLAEFFSTNEQGAFVHKADVERFLDALTSQERFPFSTEDLRHELGHTLWLLDRVASAKALKRLLEAHPVFGGYEVVLAAGDGSDGDERVADKAIERVRKAIREHDKTITLSVGQLTVGVTVPEWSGVMMLSNCKSPAAYMQAAFRAQNPYATDVVEGSVTVRMRKERAYVFDFDPARTLVVFDEFANSLYAATAGGYGTQEERRHNIRRLLNFFSVYAEDPDGSMVQIDEQQVLSIPRRLKSTEVVRHGFMSNYLFANIGNIFSAASAVADIIRKIDPAHEDKFDATKDRHLDDAEEVPVNDHGEVEVPEEVVVGRHAELFGDKVYEEVKEDVSDALRSLTDLDTPACKGDPLAKDVGRKVEEVGKALKETIREQVLEPVAEEYGLKRGKLNQLEREVSATIDRDVERIRGDFERDVNVAYAEYEREVAQAKTQADRERAEASLTEALISAKSSLDEAVTTLVEETAKTQSVEATRKMETMKAEERKSDVEDTVRAHLRGFARTIPSFIMAYGDRGLTLANFDEYTEPDVFREVTGITLEEFRFLRDGGDYTDEKGVERHFHGHLFDETVFDDSVRQFLDKREELADYFDETHGEDIFDYIPPQKTNQIFTPRWVVKKMADQLEEENPGCFDDPNATFADLYMKSGLYVTEIVKRLYASDALKTAYPDGGERLRHILCEQVFGMAPTRIIYLIATRYIFGGHEDILTESHNFVEADAAQASKDGTLGQLVEKCFGR